MSTSVPLDVPSAIDHLMNFLSVEGVTGQEANIAAAVVYPGVLRTTATLDLLDQLESSVLAYCMISESEETAWFEGTPAALVADRSTLTGEHLARYVAATSRA